VVGFVILKVCYPQLIRHLLLLNELGMEAIHEFEVEDMPVTVAVDCTGESVHISGPKEWRGKIGKL